MSDGTRLNNLLKRHNVSVETVAEKAKLVPRGVYRYLTLATIKRKTVEKLLDAAGIAISEWDNYFEDENVSVGELQEQKQEYHTKGVYHQGMNLHKIIQTKGVNLSALADQLNVARRTLYNYFDEKELPAGVLLQASEILGVDVSQIKGFGSGKAGFEKDIYNLLSQMANSLTRIEKHLQISN